MQTGGFNPHSPVVVPKMGDRWAVTEEEQMAVRQMEALPTDHGVLEVPNPEDSQTKGDA